MWLSRTWLPTSLLLAFASVIRSDVLTVGPAGSGAQFSQIQAAITAAQDDDVLLVQPGSYDRILVDKPLRILGVAAGVLIEGGVDHSAVIVRDIAAGEELVLTGVRARAVRMTTRPPTIRLENSPGTLVLSDVSILYDPFQGALVGLDVTACARVLLLDSRIHHAGELDFQTGAVVVRTSELWIAGTQILGADDPYFALSGCHGIQATDSGLRVWRSLIVGGGAEGKNGIGNCQGGTGIRATRSNLQLFGGPDMQLRGGNGEEQLFDGEGFGGPGVDLLDHSAARIQRDIPITGGFDGFDLTQAPPVRADGTSSFSLDSKVFPTLGTSAPRTQLGGTFHLTLTGNPGGYHVLYLSLRTGPTTTYRWVDGFGVLDQSNQIQLTAQVLPGGTLVFPIRVPTASALLGSTLFFQSVERYPNTVGRVGPIVRRFAIGNTVLVPITN